MDFMELAFKFSSAALALITSFYALITIPKLTYLSKKSEHIYYAIILLVPLSLAQTFAVFSEINTHLDTYGTIKLFSLFSEHLIFLRIIWCTRVSVKRCRA